MALEVGPSTTPKRALPCYGCPVPLAHQHLLDLAVDLWVRQALPMPSSLAALEASLEDEPLAIANPIHDALFRYGFDVVAEAVRARQGTV